MKFDVITLDTPWPYSKPGPAMGKAAESHYKTMKRKDILEFTEMLHLVCADNCAIFTWEVNPKRKLANEMLTIMEKHGFHYATKAFTWIKLDNSGKPYRNMGNYTASNEEPCYLWVRGSMPPVAKVVDSVIFTRGRMPHSAKPEEAQDRIELMYPLDRYKHLELFARRQRPGWTVAGYGIDGKDIRDAIKELSQL
jgi:N6-adenosine-specific RNA methylase IME4